MNEKGSLKGTRKLPFHHTASMEVEAVCPVRLFDLIVIEFGAVAPCLMGLTMRSSATASNSLNTALKVEVDEYGTGYDPNLKIVTDHVTFFDKRYVATYLPLIDKYLEWESLAVQRGDLIDRQIGEAKTWGVGGDIDLRFSIFSSGQTDHLLMIKRCPFGTCVDKWLSLSKANAIFLRALLLDFGSGKVGQSNIDAIYK